MASHEGRTAQARGGAGIQRESWRDIPCKEWPGAKYKDEYGARCYKGRNRRAHRVEWEIQTGSPPPEDLDVCHRCDNPPCYEFAHLFLGTKHDNAVDALRKGKGRGKQKLTADQVVEIREAFLAGESNVSLASTYGVHRSTISNIRTGYSWWWL